MTKFHKHKLNLKKIKSKSAKPLPDNQADLACENIIKNKSSKLSIFIASFLVIVIIVGLIISTIGFKIAKDIIDRRPEVNLIDFKSPETSKIYDENGNVIAELGAYLRENVTYDDLPTCVIDSFLAIEDSRFFEHFGFDIPRFTKAAMINLKNRDFSQGGSTFTMQLVKNTYFSIDSIENSTIASKSIDRKLQEIFIAIDIENQLSKQDILIDYLNRLNFGGNIRGIQKAAQYYFGKDVKDISLAESALLAGIINAPNLYNPYYHFELARQRQIEVLDMLLYHGYISNEDYNLAKSQKLENILVGQNNIKNRETHQYQAYIDAVIEEAIALTNADPALHSMKIYTAMNQSQQNLIEAIQNEETTVKFTKENIQTALITMNNHNGEIIALGGGRNYEGSRMFNRATDAYKQPGSAVKPFLDYALAFEYLYYSSRHVLCDRPYAYRGTDIVIKNWDRKYHGDMEINQAFAQSFNIPAIETLQNLIDTIGKEKIVEYLNEMNFEHVTLNKFDTSYAIGGSTFETTVKEMVGAYGMLLNEGKYNSPHCITKIILADGTEISNDGENKQVLSPGAAYLTTDLLNYAVDGPYYNYMQILHKKDYLVYAKTGTSDWGEEAAYFEVPKGSPKDKWMFSATSDYTNGLWLGYDKGIKGEDTYFAPWETRTNMPGHINKLLLDNLESISEDLPSKIEQPDDLEKITFTLGTWPYAIPSDVGETVTALIKKGHPALQPLHEVISLNGSNKTSISGSIDENHNLTINVGSSGLCAGGVKDITLDDGINYVSATGRCIFDPGWVLGHPTYYGTIYLNDVYIRDFETYGGSWSGYLEGDGQIKVCASSSSSSSQTCTVIN